MRIVSFIEARQDDVIRKIRTHLGLWHDDPPPRAPPLFAHASQPDGQGSPPDTPPATPACPQRTYEVDPDFLEFTRREQCYQPELPW